MLMVATTEGQEARLEHAVAAAARARPARAGGPALGGRRRGALPLAAVPARSALPRHRHRPAGEARARAAAVGARARASSLHEGTRVTAIEPGMVTTPRGSVRAGQIVVATNAR